MNLILMRISFKKKNKLNIRECPLLNRLLLLNQWYNRLLRNHNHINILIYLKIIFKLRNNKINKSLKVKQLNINQIILLTFYKILL